MLAVAKTKLRDAIDGEAIAFHQGNLLALPFDKALAENETFRRLVGAARRSTPQIVNLWRDEWGQPSCVLGRGAIARKLSLAPAPAQAASGAASAAGPGAARPAARAARARVWYGRPCS